MLRTLVRIGKAFPSRNFIAFSLMFWLIANGAPAIQKCDCPCAKDVKQAAAIENSPGTVTILWPRESNFLIRAFRSKAEIQVDSAVAGSVDFDAPLTVSIPSGPHKLTVKGKDGYETQIMVSAQKPLFFQ